MTKPELVSVTCAFGKCPRTCWKPADDADALVYCPEHEVYAGRDPDRVATAAIDAALEDLRRPLDELVRYPFESLHNMLGYLLPGSLNFGCALTGNGKTKFVAPVIAAWARQGLRPWVMPTEAMPKGLITRIACDNLGLNTDDVMSYRLRECAADDPRAAMDLERLSQEFRRLKRSIADHGADICIEPVTMLSRDEFQKSLWAAADAGSRVVVLDHCDQILPVAGVSSLDTSTGIVLDALSFAQQTGIPVLMMTQLNSDKCSRDNLAQYKRPYLNWIWQPGIKTHNASSIFGIFRPLDPNCSPEALVRAKEGGDPWPIVLPNTMGISEMKGRFSGARRDRVLHLGIQDGRLVDLPEYDQPHNAGLLQVVR